MSLEQATEIIHRDERRVQAMQEIGLALSATLDLDELLLIIVQRITQIMESDRTTLFLYDESRDELWSKIIEGNEVQKIRLPMGKGIAGSVARLREPLLIPEAYSDERFNPDIDRQSGYQTKSILCVPMSDGRDKLIGVVQTLNKNNGKAFDEDDQLLLEAVASQAAVAISNAHLYRGLVERNRQLASAKDALEKAHYELDLLYQVESAISQSFELDELLNSILTRTMQILRAEAASILLKTNGGDELYFKSAAGEKGEEIKKLRINVGHGIVGWVIENNKSLIVNDVANDSRHEEKIAHAVNFPARSIAAVPLSLDGNVIGALELINKTAENGASKFTADDARLLTVVAVQVIKALEITKGRSENRERDRLSTIGHMLSGVVHDFRTPMTVISGYTQLMAVETETDERERFYKQVETQLSVVNSMIAELMGFARGTQDILPRRVFIKDFFAEVSNTFSETCRKQNIAFFIELPFKGTARFDANKMNRVFNNLIRNALESMPGGGALTIRCEKKMAPDGKEKIFFTISDTGCGVPEEIENSLFNSFTTAGKDNGSGLGLAVTKRIVEDHEGEITFDSKRPGGTNFYICMPLNMPIAQNL